MFCIHCRKIVAIREEKGQDYYGDLCLSCQRVLRGKICQSILSRILKDQQRSVPEL